MSEKVEITDANPPLEGAAELRQPVGDQEVHRPEWLPEKFRDPEQMAEAYAALEKRMGEAGGAQPTEPAPEPEAPAPAEPTGTTPEIPVASQDEPEEFLTQFENEFAENGSISDDSYKKLAEKGYSRRHVDMYIEGVIANQAKEEARVHDAVGGADNFNTMANWAGENMPEPEVAKLNDMFKKGGEDAVLAARALSQAYQASSSAPNLIEADNLPSGGSIYESYAQMIKDIQDPLYSEDPAFRKKVADKLARTKQSGVKM